MLLSWKILGLLALLATVKGDHCPEGCECYDGFVTCMDVETVPKGLHPPIKGLSLPNHRLTRIKRVDFAGYEQSLEELSITNGTLTEIGNGTFTGMTGLLTLDLHNTNLKNIDSGIFSGLQNLVNLDLSKTRIESVQGSPFITLTALKVLDLRSNHNLKQISNEAFTGLGGLDELFLGGSSLTTFPTEALSRLESIRHLVFEDLPFVSLPEGSFRNITTLRELCIDRWPNLRQIGAQNITRLGIEELSITSTDLQRVPAELLNSKKLEILKLDDNPKLKALRLHDFANVPNLLELSLRNTGLHNMHEASFHENLQIVSLDLSNNSIASLPVHTLFQLSALEKLNISHNRFTTLTPNAFETTRQMKAIDLSDNQMICDCEIKWLKEWHAHDIRNRHIYGNCSSPRTHKGIPITGIDAKFFVCTPPRFDVHNETVPLQLDQSSIIDCVPDDGSPDPTISWSDPEGRAIPILNDKLKLDTDPSIWQLPNGSLQITGMQSSDAGIYRCNASNRLGMSIKTYRLQLGSPSEPLEPATDSTTSATAIVVIIIGLLLPLGGIIWYVRKRRAYESILENGEGTKWNSV